MSTVTKQHEEARSFHFETLDDFQNSVKHIMKIFPDLKVSDKIEFTLGDPSTENYLQIVATGVTRNDDTGELSLIVALEPTIGTTLKMLANVLQQRQAASRKEDKSDGKS